MLNPPSPATKRFLKAWMDIALSPRALTPIRICEISFIRNLKGMYVHSHKSKRLVKHRIPTLVEKQVVKFEGRVYPTYIELGDSNDDTATMTVTFAEGH